MKNLFGLFQIAVQIKDDQPVNSFSRGKPDRPGGNGLPHPLWFYAISIPSVWSSLIKTSPENFSEIKEIFMETSVSESGFHCFKGC